MSSSFRGSKKPCEARQQGEGISMARRIDHTGPVRVLLDLVLHVPTRSLGQVPWAVAKAARPAKPAMEYFMMIVSVAEVVVSWYGVCGRVVVCGDVEGARRGVGHGRRRRWRGGIAWGLDWLASSQAARRRQK